MFSILLTLCLPTELDHCSDRYRFLAGDASETQCIQTLNELDTSYFGYRIKAAHCTEAMPEPLPVTEIATGVFVHIGQIDIPRPDNAGDLSNIGFVIGETSVAVIDAGGSALVAEGLYAAIRAQTDLPVDHLILTHMHPDHTLGTPVFAALGTQIIGHPNLGPALANRVETYTRNLQDLLSPEVYAGSGIVAPERLESGVKLDLGHRTIVLTAHPTAHTDNDLSVFDETTATLFAGDLVFEKHTPALDGSILGWQNVLGDLNRFMTRHNVKHLVPGHGPVLSGAPPDLSAISSYLVALTVETRAAIQKGDSLRTAIDYIGESQRPNWQLFDEFNPRNATAAYTELEWE